MLTTHQVSLYVQANIKSEWLGLGLGKGMTDSHAYVAWHGGEVCGPERIKLAHFCTCTQLYLAHYIGTDKLWTSLNQGELHLGGYRMVGKRAEDVIETYEPLEDVEVSYEDGYLSFRYEY